MPRVGVAAHPGQMHVHYLTLVFNDTGLRAWSLKALNFREVCVKRSLVQPVKEIYPLLSENQVPNTSPSFNPCNTMAIL